jgi:putative ABC transport system permease protein
MDTPEAIPVYWKALIAVIMLVLIPFAVLIPFLSSLGLLELMGRGFGALVESTHGFGLPTGIRSVLLALPKFGIMMLKSLRRNLVRTSLVYLAIFVLVACVSGIWSVISFLDKVTVERSKDVKIIVTEKFQIPSQMPPRYELDLTSLATTSVSGSESSRKLVNNPDQDLMSWAFVGASVDPNVRSLDTMLFFFALDPKTLQTMMDDLEPSRLTAAENEQMAKNIKLMKEDFRRVIIGHDRLDALRKKIGDRITAYSFNYKDLKFEMEIVGTFPRGRYDKSAAMNVEYLRRSLDDYERSNGKKHPLADKSMNLFWARMPDKDAYEQYAGLVGAPGRFSSPAVKVEMASSAVATFLDAYKDIIAGMRYLLAPGILATMVLIISNAISISVRERQQEMAVLKVLGFQPWQVMSLVLGEAVIIGAISGAIASFFMWYLVNQQFGGVSLPIAFFGKFKIDDNALWWGPFIGALTALMGSFAPAWSARKVKVSEVFSKIA